MVQHLPMKTDLGLYVYIIDFNRDKNRMKSNENGWQHLQNNAVNNGIHNPKDLVRSGWRIKNGLFV